MDGYNLTTLKNVLYLEVENYNSKNKEIAELMSDMATLKDMITYISNFNYDDIDSNFILFDSCLPLILNLDDKQADKMLGELYNSFNYVNLEKQNRTFSRRLYSNSINYINKINNILKNKLAEYQVLILSKKNSLNEEDIISYRSIISKIKFKKKIDKEDYDILRDFFEKKGYSNKEQILFLEKVRDHNIRIDTKEAYKINNQTYEVTDMLNYGMEKITIPYIISDRINELNVLSVVLTNLISQLPFEDILEMLPSYEKNGDFSKGFSFDEVRYLYLKILKNLQESMLEAYNEILKMENYKNIEFRKFVINQYYINQRLYLNVRRYFDKILKDYDFDISKVSEEEDVNKLCYTTRTKEIDSKTFFETDLKKINNDLYKKVMDLITLFKKNKLPGERMKPLSNNKMGYSEIKYDQIRIVYKHLKDNLYEIIGVFVKKDNNKQDEFDKLYDRNIDNFLMDDNVEEHIFEILDKNKHNGGRVNA